MGNARGAHAVRGVQRRVHEAAPRHHRRAAARRELLRLPLEAARPAHEQHRPRRLLHRRRQDRPVRRREGARAAHRRSWSPTRARRKPDDFFPGLFGAAEQDGEIFAAPNDSNPDVLWYDKQALAAAGITEDPATLAESGEWTTEKYLEMNDKLAAAGLTGSMFWNYWATHYSWISSQGGTAYDESGAFVGNDDATTVDAVDTLGRVLPGRHLRRRRLDARGRRRRQRVRDPQGGLLLAGPLHDRHRRERRRAGQLRHRPLAHARRPGRSDRRRHLVPGDQRQDRGEGRRVHVLDRVPLGRGPGLPPRRAAATRSRRSRAPTRSCSRTATRPTRRRSSTCATSASRTTPPRRSCPGSRPT